MNKLYKLALTENEGLGTAYEYFVKLKLLDRLLKNKKIKNVLIYGLPQRYGFSMDFFYYFSNKNIQISLFEKRKDKVSELKVILKKLNYEKEINKIKLIKKINQKFDLIISCEVLQSLSKKELCEYIKNIENFAENALIFVPNKNNQAHNRISGLKSFYLSELKRIFRNIKESGYIDMPPFPPGIKRKNKIKNNLVVLFLEFYTLLEEIIPSFIKKRIAHINYIWVEL